MHLYKKTMYYCKVESYDTDEPVYQRLQGGKDYFFFAESRVAKDYVRTGLYEKPVIQWAVDTFVKPDKACIDIGAHMGMYSLAMANKAQHVYAFECSPKSFNYLCANIALQNQHYMVDKYNVALSNKEGTAKYFIRDPKDGGANGISEFPWDRSEQFQSVDVPTRTLDSFGFKNIGFMKIDVEGHEKEVLEGSLQTLKDNGYPPFLFESWVPNDDDKIPRKKIREELFQYIESIGYRIQPVRGWPEEFLAVHPANSKN
jgi:FkbM family methyltransferase